MPDMSPDNRIIALAAACHADNRQVVSPVMPDSFARKVLQYNINSDAFKHRQKRYDAAATGCMVAVTGRIR